MRTAETMNVINEVANEIFGGNVEFTQVEAIQPGTSVFIFSDPNQVLPSDFGLENILKRNFANELSKRTGVLAVWVNNPYSLRKTRLVVFHKLEYQTYLAIEQAIKNACRYGADGFIPVPAAKEGTNENFIEFKLCYSGDGCDGMENIENEFRKLTGIDCCLGNHYFCICLDKKIDVEALLAEEKAAAEAKALAEAQKAAEKKEYARKAGRLARKYNIPFINVLRLGHDEKILKAHADSIRNAKQTIKAMSADERKKLYHELFVCGRARKNAVLASLNVYTGSADVNHMDFSMLNIK